MNIKDMLLIGESEELEFKVDVPPKSDSYMKSVVAFANGNGGTIVFGVDDKTHEIRGFDRFEAGRHSSDKFNPK